MRFRISFRNAVPLCAIVTALTACGGGGGGGGGDKGGPEPPVPPPVEGIPTAPTTPVALTTQADVLREVGNTIDVYAAFFNLQLGDGSAKLAREPDALLPKAAAIEPCELGGTRTTDSDSRTRAFAYFAVSDTVGVSTEMNAGCAENDVGGSGTYTTVEGYFEQGDTAINPAGETYSYERYGIEGGRYAERRLDPAAPDDFDYRDVSGLTEYFLPVTATETRSVRESRYEVRDGTDYRAGAIVQGEDGDPFVTRFEPASGALSFEGPYRYATQSCAGGRVRIATVEAVTLDATNYPDGGALDFSNGTSTVHVTFNLDGGASYQFEGGTSGTLTREEVVASPRRC